MQNIVQSGAVPYVLLSWCLHVAWNQVTGFFSAFHSFRYKIMTPCIHRLWPSHRSLVG